MSVWVQALDTAHQDIHYVSLSLKREVGNMKIRSCQIKQFIVCEEKLLHVQLRDENIFARNSCRISDSYKNCL